MSALVLIKEVTANNANVVQVTDCFSATYSHYYITITDHQPASQRENNSADFRLINSSGNIVAQDYDARALFFLIWEKAKWYGKWSRDTSEF